MEEIRFQTQGSGVSVAYYVTPACALMRRLSNPLTVSQQIRQLVKILCPEVRNFVRETEVRTISDVLSLADNSSG